MKLMDIDSEHLGIPETEYKATVRMSSSEFQRIIRDLSTMGDTCTIDATKEGIKFSTSGEGGSGNVTIKQSAVADKVATQLAPSLCCCIYPCSVLCISDAQSIC